MSIVPFVLLVIVSLLFVLILASDILRRSIPNKWTLLIFVLSMTYSLDKNGISNLGFVFTVFLIGLILWRFGLLGGGDVKLLVAVSPFINTGFYIDWLFLISLIGAGTAIVIYILHKNDILKSNSVPYSIAITVGSWLGIVASII